MQREQPKNPMNRWGSHDRGDRLSEPWAANPAGVDQPRIPEQETASWDNSPPGTAFPLLRQFPGAVFVRHGHEFAVVVSLPAGVDDDTHTPPETKSAVHGHRGCCTASEHAQQRKYSESSEQE